MQKKYIRNKTPSAQLPQALGQEAALGGGLDGAAQPRDSSLEGTNGLFQVCAAQAGRAGSDPRARALRRWCLQLAGGQPWWKGRSPTFPRPSDRSQ